MASNNEPAHISELFDRLKASGWSIGSTAYATDKGGLSWAVDGRNVENVIRAEGATESAAWWSAIEQARTAAQ